MIIDFKNIEKATMKNFYGGEGVTAAHMFVDEKNRIMLGTLEPGDSIGIHKHENGSEVIYILQGAGKAVYDDVEEALTAGSCHYCPKGHSHSLINNGKEPLVFFAVVPQQ